MNKKLHRVEVVLYVMAEDESDARWAATNAHFDVFECVAEEAQTLDPGWEDAVPYNADDSRTCAEIFTSQIQVDHSGAKSIKSPHAGAANGDVSPMKHSPGKHPEGLGAGWLMIGDFFSRLVSLTQQDLKDAGVSLQRMRD